MQRIVTLCSFAIFSSSSFEPAQSKLKRVLFLYVSFFSPLFLHQVTRYEHYFLVTVYVSILPLTPLLLLVLSLL